MKKLFLLAFALVGCGTPKTIAGPTDVDVYSKVASSAVGIQMASGTGSGTVVYSDDQRALVLTCAHVVVNDDGEAATDVQVVVTRAGRFQFTYPAEVLQLDIGGDLALLATPSLGSPAMRIAGIEPHLYTRLFSVASPTGVNNTASSQLLTSKVFALPFHRGPVWQLTGFTMPGSSGGTVADGRGDLVCVIEAGRVRNGFPIAEMGFCIGLPDIKSFLKGYKL